MYLNISMFNIDSFICSELRKKNNENLYRNVLLIDNEIIEEYSSKKINKVRIIEKGLLIGKLLFLPKLSGLALIKIIVINLSTS